MPPLDSAGKYINQGFNVHPCCPPDHDCKSPGKVPFDLETGQHRKDWQTHEMPSLGEIERWRESEWYEVANIGFLCGSPSELLCVDIDSPEAEKLFAELATEHGFSRLTWTYRTGNGTRYLYRTESSVSSLVINMGDAQIEILGDGKQTVCPPSRHPSNKNYKWSSGRNPGCCEALEVPEFFIRLRKTSSATIETEWRNFIKEDVPQGKRNETATRLAGHLLSPGKIPAEEAYELIKAWSMFRCNPPLPDSEIQTIIRSISKREEQSGDMVTDLMSQGYSYHRARELAGRS